MASVLELFAAHRAAVLADEAMYDADGHPIDKVGAEATEKAETAAFIALVGAPCFSHPEVAAKVSYFVSGTIGERSGLIEYLMEYSDGGLDLVERLLRSLVIARGEKMETLSHAEAPAPERPSAIEALFVEWMAARNAEPPEDGEEGGNSRYEAVQHAIVTTAPVSVRDVALQYIADTDFMESYPSDHFEAVVRRLAAT